MTLKLNGSSSGHVNLDAKAAAASNTLTLPDTANGELVAADSSGHINLADNKEIKFGASNDLQLYHDSGGTSYLKHSHSGGNPLQIHSNGDVKIKVADTEDGIIAMSNGGVKSYYNNTLKFETLTNGAKVHGKLYSTISSDEAASFNRDGSAGTLVQLVFQGTVCGGINVDTNSTTYATSSDYRLKENQVAISDGITRLKTLKPYRFNWKGIADKTIDGFFAHEVTAVPEAITGEKDGTEMQGIDQSKLVPLLTAALQEAITKIETLETKVAALEGS